MIMNRRQWLIDGGLGLFGLNLAGLLQARAATEDGSHERKRESQLKACILIFYYGGPSHLDTLDLKPNAAAEVRGQFSPIATAAPGVHICEPLPMTARMMDKIAIIRSMHHKQRLAAHDPACHHMLTGRVHPAGDRNVGETPESFPSYGAVLSYLGRHKRLEVPLASLPFVMRNIQQNMGQTAGFLGPAYNPFRIEADPGTLTYQADALKLRDGMTLKQLRQRERLLKLIERSAEHPVQSQQTARLRVYYEKAFDLLGSQRVRQALNIEQEDQKTRQRYGYGPAGQSYQDGPFGDNGAHLGISRNMRGLNLLMARRLVEAGVPFVNVYDFKQQGKNWDSHSDNFTQHKDHLLPMADRALSALIEDLDQRGMLDSTLVVATGEFGRTPKINASAGRDHWPDCYSVLLAGGGVKGGFVYGSSDKIGAYPETDAVTPGDLAATIFAHFGFDPSTEIHDPTGRPYRIAEGRSIDDLFV